MSSPLSQAIVELATRAEPSGISMGRLVDALEGEGHPADAVEREVWTLLGQRRLTPCGFVCRKVRRKDPLGEIERVRTYEFLFVPWSDQLDRQLDLELPEPP